MSLSNPLPRATRQSPTYVADGITATYPFPFWFLDGLDLVVALQATPSSPPTYLSGLVGYTATGAGNNGGGYVTLAAVPAVRSLVTIYGRRVGNRLTSVINDSVVVGVALEKELDVIELTLQELRRDVDRGNSIADAAKASADASAALLSELLALLNGAGLDGSIFSTAPYNAQLRAALANGNRALGVPPGSAMTVALRIDADPTAPDNLQWRSRGRVVSGDPLWTVMRAALGLDAAQADLFLAFAATFPLYALGVGAQPARVADFIAALAAGAPAYGVPAGSDIVVATHVDADPDAPDRIEWDTGLYVASHDPLWIVARDALALSDAQMDGFLSFVATQ